MASLNFIEHTLQPRSHLVKREFSACVVLPYVSQVSERISQILRRFDVKVYHKPFFKLSNIFTLPKDPIVFDERCSVVYRIPRIVPESTSDKRETASKQESDSIEQPFDFCSLPNQL